MTIHLRCASSAAILLPERGGLLAQLDLADDHGTPVRVFWLPSEFKREESGWPGGGMPMMFPFAGRVFDAGNPFSYQLGGQAFHMPLHGFAYGLPWHVDSTTEQEAVLTLYNDMRTYELYPFEFKLTAEFRLEAQKVTVQLKAKHLSNRLAEAPKMPVAMGFHPYFRIPLTSGGQAKTTRLQTHATQQIDVTPIGAAGRPKPFPSAGSEAAGQLHTPAFANVILGGLKQPSARLWHEDSSLELNLEWSSLGRYLVLWNGDGQHFHCIEPWQGLPDALHNNDGCHWLAPGEETSLSFSIRLSGTQL